MAKNISRKDFLKGAAMSAAGVGLFASGLMNAAAEEEKPEYKNSSNWVLASQNVKWDEEHDIVIAGYGGVYRGRGNRSECGRCDL